MADLNEKRLLVNEEEENGIFSLQSIWELIFDNWRWILLSIVACLSLAFVYLRYKAPTYSASMKVLIKDAESKNRAFQGLALDQMGLMSNSNGFDNEIEILTSATVANRVVKRLKLYVRYFSEGKVVNRELYKNSPILVDMEENYLDVLQDPMLLVLTKTANGVHVDGYFNPEDTEELSLSREINKFPATIETQNGTLILQNNILFETEMAKLIEEAEKEGREEPVDIWKEGSRIRVTVYPPKYVGRLYSTTKVTASPTSKTTTVASVGLTDTKKARALDYLNELFVCYNEDANEDKNEVARKTEEFISERLESIREELDQTEGNMESYKKDNELINLANDATVLLEGSSDYRKELIKIQTQISLLKSLMDYMDDPTNYLQIIPANLGLENSAMLTPLISMLSEYNEIVLKRNRLLKGSGEENPVVSSLTKQLTDMWPTIRQNMGNIYKNIETQKKSISQEYSVFTSRVTKTPTQERVLTNILRRQTLQSELYLTLLQKREENYIQLYSTAAKARIIEEPYIIGKVSPKSSVIMLAALVVGACLPIGIFILISLLQIRIKGREDVEKLTKLPILADIPQATNVKDGGAGVVVRENNNGMNEEAFRGLRTNLGFVLKPNEKVILVTSCIPGEGKTHVAMNLSMSMALLGKKVVIIGLDIRKPRLVALFKLKPTKKGIVSFLCLDKPDYELLDDQIIPSGIHSNLDVLPAGLIPPNPAELLNSPMLKSAIDHLTEKYDYVVLDTPPVGLVADTLDIGRNANMSIIVARENHSLKSNFELVNIISENGLLPNCNLVLNGVDVKKRKSSYRYGKYGQYGQYGRYGQYGMYGHYGSENGSKTHVEK